MVNITLAKKYGNQWFVVDAPFLPSAIHAWRQVFGRVYNGETKTNWVPVKYKRSLRVLLEEYYPDHEIVWPS